MKLFTIFFNRIAKIENAHVLQDLQVTVFKTVKVNGLQQDMILFLLIEKMRKWSQKIIV